MDADSSAAGAADGTPSWLVAAAAFIHYALFLISQQAAGSQTENPRFKSSVSHAELAPAALLETFMAG